MARVRYKVVTLSMLIDDLYNIFGGILNPFTSHNFGQEKNEYNGRNPSTKVNEN